MQDTNFQDSLMGVMESNMPVIQSISIVIQTWN